MASATSNSSTSSYATAFGQLFEATRLMEDWTERVTNASLSRYATPAGSQVSAGVATTAGSVASARSQVTALSVGSQVTVQGSARSQVLSFSAPATTKPTVVSDQDPKYGGLEKDLEGVETKKEMLIRRRKECSVEEVDVALAPVMKIPVPYCFYPEQFKRFRAMFPRVNADSGLSYTHHDHPVSHTATMVGIRRIQGNFKSGELVLDLHGNPNGNEQFNRFQTSRIRKRPGLPVPPLVETLVQEVTSDDAVRRVTKWGPMFLNGVRRYWEMPLDDITPGLYDVFTSIHTLYYYSMYQVNTLLSKNRRAKIHALVNYSKEQSGTLYGELKFHKEGGMTTQISPNGERYRHPDIDSWFQTNSFRAHTETLGCGIAWTSTCIGGPLYILTITSCDWATARTHRYEPPSAPTLKVSEGRNLFCFVKMGGSSVRLDISNADLAAEMRHWMTFRDRNNPQTFMDLCVKARRITGSDVLDGSRQFQVADGKLQEHIIYAYLVDAPGELELMEGVKLLRGDLLEPLAESLKLQGRANKDTIFQALTAWVAGRKKPMEALGHRSTPFETGKRQNTGGLLPTCRT